MITISHTHAAGTLLEGSRKGDGIYEVLRGLRDNWRYFRSIQVLGIGQSRDRNADTYKIKRAAEALRAAGHEVTTEIDETERRTFAEAEAERNERAEDRAERMAGYAANAAARSEAGFARASQIADMIPMGQPILVGHHSEGRHRRDLARIDAGMRAGVDEGKKAEHYERRAENAETYQAGRESVPVTLRRIAKLEAEERQLQRRLNGTGLAMHGEDEAATGAYAERLKVRLGDIADEVAHWRAVVECQRESGVKIWSRDDFAKGDFVQFLGGWYEVLRVSAKSVTIPAMISDGPIVTKANSRMSWTDTVPYHKVKGRKSAAEMAELLAEVERRESVSA
jgi:hypothetical protein